MTTPGRQITAGLPDRQGDVVYTAGSTGVTTFRLADPTAAAAPTTFLETEMILRQCRAGPLRPTSDLAGYAPAGSRLGSA